MSNHSWGDGKEKGPVDCTEDGEMAREGGIKSGREVQRRGGADRNEV